MKEYSLPHFGIISMEKLEDSYRTSIDFNGGFLRIDLNFEKKTADPSAMEKAKGFIGRIDEFYSLNSAHLINDYEHGQLIREYIEFHLEELQKDKLYRLVDYGNKDITPEKQLFYRLKLERIGLYPEKAYQECFAVFDYTLEGNIYIDGRRTVTDQIIAVKTDEKWKFRAYSMGKLTRAKPAFEKQRICNRL